MIRNADPNAAAIITGAAGGFGSCFSERLAEMGCDLILIDRREESLQRLHTRISQSVNVRVQTLVADLTNQSDVDRVTATLEHRSNIEFLINNAGFAHLKNFIEIDINDHRSMVALHVSTPMQLIRVVLPNMIEQGHGNIINVSSLGAWLPSGDAQYAATKAYLLVLSQSLHEEVRQHGIRVQALCPSFVDTGFHDTAEMARFPRHAIPPGMWMRAHEVIDCSLRGLMQNRVVVIPGWKNRLVSIALRSPYLQPIVSKLIRPKQRPMAMEALTPRSGQNQ